MSVNIKNLLVLLTHDTIEHKVYAREENKKCR
jgi:hypothetical protein